MIKEKFVVSNEVGDGSRIYSSTLLHLLSLRFESVFDRYSSFVFLKDQNSLLKKRTLHSYGRYLIESRRWQNTPLQSELERAVRTIWRK
jgi:hypothetical protein